MSTRQGMVYEMTSAEESRSLAEAQRRALELARLRAEQAAAIHTQVEEMHGESERLRAALLTSQAQETQQIQEALAALAARGKSAGFLLEDLARAAQESRQALEQARSAVSIEMDRLEGLCHAVECQRVVLAATLSEANATLARLGAASTNQVAIEGALVDAAARGLAFATRQAELDLQIRELEAEVGFLRSQAELTPIALVTLEAMKSNGYQLKSTMGREALLAYFQREGEAHQIAVRLAPIERNLASSQRWEMLAETFALPDPSCLEAIDDFETAIEEQNLGQLRRNGPRVYPRDDWQAVVPAPTATANHRRAPISDVGSREKSRWPT